LSAHLFVYYFAVLAGVTPPVCVPAFCAASIAKSKPLQTGFEAFKLAMAGFLIPYVFVFNPALLMQGTAMEIITVTMGLLLAIIFFAGALSGYFLKPLSFGLQVILFILAGLTTFVCAKPDLINTPIIRILGILILLAILLRPFWLKSRASKEITQESNA
ncbi:MAG: TRAP transporter large permease subunit, partial [bacterium]|nr:TRAP transporter large permease subunit [bacterium]